MTKSLSELITTNRPSLCAYCKNPAKGFLYREDDKYFGACSMEHLAKIKLGERLNKMAYLNEEGIAYATIKSKEKYLALAKKNESYVIHEWTGEDRQKLFGEAIKNYLDWAAQTGNVGKITRDGT